jgi:hypothetical protein
LKLLPKTQDPRSKTIFVITSVNMIAARVNSVPVAAMISSSSSVSSKKKMTLKNSSIVKRGSNVNLSATASDWDTFSVFLRKQCEAAAKEGSDSKKWDDVRAINSDAKSVYYQKFPSASATSSSSKEAGSAMDSGMDEFCDGNEDAAECKVFD